MKAQVGDPVVLLVEDDSDDALLVSLAFKRAGWVGRLHVVQDGEAAVQYLGGDGIFSDRNTHPFPTFVLLDLKLPRRSGFEVLAWVRSNDTLRRLPIVVLTSSQHSVDIERCYDLGANSFLVKRVGLSASTELMQAVKEYWFGANESPRIQHIV